MRVEGRSREAAGLLLALLVGVPAMRAQAGAGRAKAVGGQGRCRSAVIEGEVSAGQGMRRSFTTGLDVLLEPVDSGWVLRVLPRGEARQPEDFAELATPPFRSISPLRVSTEFGFRAQDAVGWNPRHFRYASDRRVFARLEELYRRLGNGRPATAADEGRLGEIASAQPAGELRIVDARLTPGTGDASRAAALLATHFDQTAHQLDAPGRLGATPLGRLSWMRVHVTLQLGAGATVQPGVTVVPTVCGG